VDAAIDANAAMLNLCVCIIVRPVASWQLGMDGTQRGVGGRVGRGPAAVDANTAMLNPRVCITR
jgi:hypothetical protein